MTLRRLVTALGFIPLTVAPAHAHHPMGLPPPSTWPPIVQAIMWGVLAFAIGIVIMAIITTLIRRRSSD